ncbi:MAG: ATP-binding cassette domain-containing protein [Calditrichae bacterium]|nr:ABC transporter ATP-binding protein [Calditrichia bacterium]NOQ97072.1 ATP-binding cassette domain-containing protein [Calditrichia bacterium]
MWTVEATDICQRFNRRLIFENISFEVSSGHSLAISGPNGSGKTTLVKIICQLLRPTAGKMLIKNEDELITSHEIYPYLGLVGPYLQLYHNLTAFENYTFFSRIRGRTVDTQEFKSLMGQLGLKSREFDEIRTFSSGMMQRLKYVMAIMHHPEILLVDEPTANLDEEGSEIVYELMESQKKKKILILATNEPEELKFGDEKIILNS